MGFLSEVLKQVREHHAALFHGYAFTVYLTLASFAGSLGLGFVVSLLRTSESRILRTGAGAYVEFFRNTPLLVQLFLWFFALPKLPHFQAPLIGQVSWLLSPIQASLLGLTLYTG